MKSKRLVRPSLVVLAIAALAALAAACGGTTSADGASSTPAAASPATSSAAATPTETPTSGGDDDTSTGGVTVTIADSAFSPSKIEVQTGTTVTWTNNDPVPHTVTSTQSDDVDSATSGLFDSGTLRPGDSFSYTFKKAGDYPYVCTFHASMASMHGKVEVK